MTRDRLIQATALATLLASTGVCGALVPRITEISRRHAMRYTDVPVEGAPPFVALGTMIGALRGIIVDYLWIKVHLMKEKGQYYEIMADADLITKLQPRFAPVWAFHGHNMAYNISVAHNTKEERWEWVQKGIGLVRNEGLRYNPNDLPLHKELAFWFLHKIEGVADDAHLYYKSELAREWHDVLGEPPADQQARIEWIRRIAEAPETLEEAQRRTPGVAALVERLRSALSPYGARFRFALDRRFLREVARRQAIRETSEYALLLGLQHFMTSGDQEPDERVPEETRVQRQVFRILDEAATDEETREAWEALVAHVRKRVLQDDYNMDPGLMYEFTRDYGPIDWRHGGAHALYWALRGSREGEERVAASEEDVYRIVNNDRMKLQSMQALARSGRIAFDPYGSDLPSRLPDPRWIAPVDRYWEELSVKHEHTRGPGADLFIDFHKNFLSSAVRELWRSGETQLAQHYLGRLDSLYGTGARRGLGDPKYSLPLDIFSWKETEGEYDAQPHLAPSDVFASVRYGLLVGLGDNRRDILDRALAFAGQVTDLFKGSKYTDFETKMGTGRLKDLIFQLEDSVEIAFGQLMVDTSVPLLTRLKVYARAGPELQKRVYDDVRAELRRQFGESRLAAIPSLDFDAVVLKEPPGMDAHRQKRALELQERARALEEARRAEVERR